MQLLPPRAAWLYLVMISQSALRRLAVALESSTSVVPLRSATGGCSSAASVWASRAKRAVRTVPGPARSFASVSSGAVEGVLPEGRGVARPAAATLRSPAPAARGFHKTAAALRAKKRRNKRKSGKAGVDANASGPVEVLSGTSGAGAPARTTSRRLHGGSVLSLETGRLATLADGAVYASHGDTAVLATAVADFSGVQEGSDFLPLQVDYVEKMFASGRIPETFARREMGVTDKEILGSRIIDRTLRPLFPPGYFAETQIVATVMSYDEGCDAEVLAVNAASTALCLSSIPFDRPAGAVRVAWNDGQPVLNPSADVLESSPLNLLYAAAGDKCVMIEVAAKELPEADLVKALRFAHRRAMDVVELQEALMQKCGKKKRYVPSGLPSEELQAEVRRRFGGMAREVFSSSLVSKDGRASAMGAYIGRVTKEMGEDERFSGVAKGTLQFCADLIAEEQLRELLLESSSPVASSSLSSDDEDDNASGADSSDDASESDEDQTDTTGLVQRRIADAVRPDGRHGEQVRPLGASTGVLPRAHGSALFSRGDTAAVCTATLGPPEMVQRLRAVAGGPSQKHFFLHYEFPPYSVNEVGKVGGVNRRMIGHGALAEKAVAAVFPPPEEYPHVVRVTSTITGSDGSSSMASVCGATLALMDAGVPIKSPVAGISVGLVTPPAGIDADPQYVLLTDILGMEDHFLDMDFKVAGTSSGVTAVQLDTKLSGVPLEILEKALMQATEARIGILATMAAELAAPRDVPKSHAPRLERILIPMESRGRVLGPRGETIKAIEDASGAALRLEDGDNYVQVWASNEYSFEKARDAIMELASPKVLITVGNTYYAKVSELRDFGAIVDVVGDDGSVVGGGLLHVSELEHSRTENVSDVLEAGQQIKVMAIDVDASGRGRFSIKALSEVRPGQQGWRTVAAATAAKAVATAPTSPDEPWLWNAKSALGSADELLAQFKGDTAEGSSDASEGSEEEEERAEPPRTSRREKKLAKAAEVAGAIANGHVVPAISAKVGSSKVRRREQTSTKSKAKKSSKASSSNKVAKKKLRSKKVKSSGAASAHATALAIDRDAARSTELKQSFAYLNDY